MTLTLKKATLTLKMCGSVHLPQRGHALILGLWSPYLGSYRELSYNIDFHLNFWNETAFKQSS